MGALRITFALAFMMTLASKANAEMTANRFLSLYDTNAPEEKEIYAALLGAYAGGIEWTQVDLKHEQTVCEPDKLPLTKEQLVDMLRSEIVQEPFVGKYPYGLAMLRTLQQIFPCPKNSN